VINNAHFYSVFAASTTEIYVHNVDVDIVN